MIKTIIKLIIKHMIFVPPAFSASSLVFFIIILVFS